MHGSEIRQLLDSYTAERIPIIKDVIETTDHLTKVMGTPNKFVQALRDAVIPMVSRLAPFQHAFVQRLSELGIAYRGSPIVEGPGKRYFDDSLRGGKGIRNRFLLVIDADQEDIYQGSCKATLRIRLAHCRITLGAATGITLVRPDGYIAYSAHKNDSIASLTSVRSLLERQTRLNAIRLCGAHLITWTQRRITWQHPSISTEDISYRKRVSVLDTNMAYVDVGEGDPIVFLHGNPTPSYLWRNIIPYVLPFGRCLAPDYVGMGNSGTAPNGSYRFVDHRRYLDAWFDAMQLTKNIILVVHDWGSALGFSWAQRHPEKIKAIVYMEGIVRPFLSWDEWPEATREFFKAQRTPAGEDLILQKNLFIEYLLPLRGISDGSHGGLSPAL